MQILVTGGSGAIGRFVSGELSRRGHDVTVFDQVAPKFSAVDVEPNRISFVEGDVTEAAAVQDEVKPADVVVHLPALLPDQCEVTPRRAEQVNVGGTLNVLDAAAGTNTRVLCASSKAVYGTVTGVHAHPTYEPMSEDAPKSPTNVYGATKLAVECYCNAYARNKNLDVAWFRFATTFGPGKGDTHGKLSLLSRLVERGAAGEEITVSGTDQRTDFLYYPDLAAGVAAAVETDTLTYRAYHLGSDQAAPLRAYAESVQSSCPSAEIEIEGGLDFFDQTHPRYCRLDISRARSDLGYEPQFGPEAAVEDYLRRILGEKD